MRAITLLRRLLALKQTRVTAFELTEWGAGGRGRADHARAVLLGVHASSAARVRPSAP